MGSSDEKIVRKEIRKLENDQLSQKRKGTESSGKERDEGVIKRWGAKTPPPQTPNEENPYIMKKYEVEEKKTSLI